MSDRKRTSLEEKWETGEAAAADAAVDAADDPTEDELAIAQAEIVRLRDQVLRQQAEMVNFRRRTERDREEAREQSRAGVVRELLAVIDDFERAAAFETDNLEAYRDGVQLILRSVADALQRLGVQRVDPYGEAFDPHEHDALDRTPSDDVPADHVARVYKPGYRLGERLLRPAVVAVSSGASAAPEGVH